MALDLGKSVTFQSRRIENLLDWFLEIELSSGKRGPATRLS